VLSGYITTLKNKKKHDVSGPSSRVNSSKDRGKCTGFILKSMKASHDKKINQLDGFNHNKV
jgi:ribosomal protein S17E